MSKSKRNNIAQITAILFTSISFYIAFETNTFNIYTLFGILTIAAMLNGVVYSLLPANKTRKSSKREGNKPSKKKTKNISRSKGALKKSTNFVRSDSTITQLPINELGWREFERLCFLYFKAKGYNPEETSKGADGGVDLIFLDPSEHTRVAVQIKKYQKQITVREIRELHAAKRNHNCMLATFITSSSFTRDALLQADRFGIKTCDSNWLNNHIVKWQKQLNSQNKKVN
ncbi:restriction endonuclease [Jeotgalibacillus sp. ET6]|uniref:restriction endonuclease n=1 Tax=Jeotgalibacillus sp. ET6 TaxID=3037260 RepID=UPI0024183989|nr:restriction endonuclease [Jeotgalibacillus sp. ET6]MDG5471495.1 restriction endonuclease [Jeotgalibacillus sp. ET6]